MVGVNYLAPYFLSFVIAEFVLVMQFLWQYIDDITGKGIGFFEIMELVLCFACRIIPLAIPITILLSSVFVFGNMSEKFELSSLKSAGISLLRIMKVGFYLATITALFSLLASNYLVPKANYEFFSRFDLIRKQKPALGLEENFFNKDLSGYSIYVKEKDKDGKTIKGVIIYDEVHSPKNSFNIVTAQRGVMSSSDDGKYFLLNLEDGEQYLQSKENDQKNNVNKELAFTRTKFKKWEKAFPMSQFDVGNKIFYEQKRKYDLMNTFQLLSSLDSLESIIESRKLDNYHDFNGVLASRRNKKVKIKTSKNISENKATESLRSLQDPQTTESKSAIMNNVIEQKENTSGAINFLSTYNLNDHLTLVHESLSFVQSRKREHFNNGLRITDKRKEAEEIKLDLHQKYSWAAICIIFLFIGAPLGSIIRKGGYGYPLLGAIAFFMFFIILGIIGKKLQQAQSMDAIVAAWLPCIVLAPLAIYLTIKALDDQKLIELNWLTNIKTRFQSSKAF